MSIKKLLVSNMHEGLRLVKDRFGPDALILKTVKRNGKIELYVEAPDEPIEELPDLELNHIETHHFETHQFETDARAANRLKVSEVKPREKIKSEYLDAKYRMLNAIGDRVPEKSEAPGAADSTSHKRSASARDSMGVDASFDTILGSMNSSSLGMERTVASVIEGLQLDVEVAGRIRDCRRVDELSLALAQLIQTDVQPAVGIKAFVGPSGSGKTTSLIKLITRRVMQFGASSCAIINCDRYRVGASQQLDRLGELMDVEVIHLGPGVELSGAIARVKHREFIAIDMPGLSMADKNLAGELARLDTGQFDIGRYLVLPANLQSSVMHRAAMAYGHVSKTSCIFTRLDETDSLGSALSFLIRRNINLAFTCNGTHIPEDIQAARSDDFIQDAINLMDQAMSQSMSQPIEYKQRHLAGSEFAKAPMRDFTYNTSKEKLFSKMVMDV